MEALYSKETLKKEPVNKRIGLIVADGMWWSFDKWKNAARVTDEELQSWIDTNMENGNLIQSETGARSYRFSLDTILKWHNSHNIPLGTQLVDFLFPPRIWDGMTETEAFLEAPLREIGTVTFNCSSKNVVSEIIHELKGVGRVREIGSDRYRVYGLSSTYMKEIITQVFKKHERNKKERVTLRLSAYRREIVDFSSTFIDGMMKFYKGFARTLVKGSMETIRIYIPDPEDQDSQVVYWLISAIEKFDEKTSVPFSGYLNSALRHWPYDLPAEHLGKDLSNFQLAKSKALKKLHVRIDDKEKALTFSNDEIAQEMGVDLKRFNDLDESHRNWLNSRSATTLTWDESSDEKKSQSFSDEPTTEFSSSTDKELASKISKKVVEASIESGKFDDGLTIISQIDANNINYSEMSSLSLEFIQAFGEMMKKSN